LIVVDAAIEWHGELGGGRDAEQGPDLGAQLVAVGSVHDLCVDGAVSVVVNPRRRGDDYVGANDGHGDAMILFSGSTDRGDGAPWPYSSGVYTTVIRH
jgi:hypothetical protein